MSSNSGSEARSTKKIGCCLSMGPGRTLLAHLVRLLHLVSYDGLLSRGNCEIVRTIVQKVVVEHGVVVVEVVIRDSDGHCWELPALALCCTGSCKGGSQAGSVAWSSVRKTSQV